MSKKTREYLCPYCGEVEEVYNDSAFDDIDCTEKNGDIYEFISVRRKCAKCGSHWTEHLRLVYDGYYFNGREYDENGECIVDWVDEDSNPYEGVLQ